MMFFMVECISLQAIAYIYVYVFITIYLELRLPFTLVLKAR